MNDYDSRPETIIVVIAEIREFLIEKFVEKLINTNSPKTIPERETIPPRSSSELFVVERHQETKNCSRTRNVRTQRFRPLFVIANERPRIVKQQNVARVSIVSPRRGKNVL